MDRDLRCVTVWYTPQNDALDIKSGADIILDPTLSAAFEVAAANSRIMPAGEIFSPNDRELIDLPFPLSDVIPTRTELQSVGVWYRPQAESRFGPMTRFIIDDSMSETFEELLRISTPLDTDTLRSKYKPSTWESSHCRAQIFSQPGTADIRTAEALAKYYRGIEYGDWDSVHQTLAPYLTCTVPNGFYPAATTRTSDEHITQVKLLRDEYPELWLDVNWAHVESRKAVVEFCMWSEGRIVVAGLTQYSFEIIDNVPLIYSIFSHSHVVDGSVIPSTDGGLQWTALGPIAGDDL